MFSQQNNNKDEEKDIEELVRKAEVLSEGQIRFYKNRNNNLHFTQEQLFLVLVCIAIMITAMDYANDSHTGKLFCLMLLGLFGVLNQQNSSDNKTIPEEKENFQLNISFQKTENKNLADTMREKYHIPFKHLSGPSLLSKTQNLDSKGQAFCEAAKRLRKNYG